MPTLVFGENFTAFERCVLSKTFRANCADLGISGRDCSVQLERRHLPENCGGRMTCINDKFFIVQLNETTEMIEQIGTLGHETIHIKQHLLGELRDDKKMGEIHWKQNGASGVFPMALAPALYKHLPWEVEAHGNDKKLFLSALNTITMDEMKVMVQESNVLKEMAKQGDVLRKLDKLAA